jgi:hypothetical protein
MYNLLIKTYRRKQVHTQGRRRGLEWGGHVHPSGRHMRSWEFLKSVVLEGGCPCTPSSVSCANNDENSFLKKNDKSLYFT